MSRKTSRNSINIAGLTSRLWAVVLLGLLGCCLIPADQLLAVQEGGGEETKEAEKTQPQDSGEQPIRAAWEYDPYRVAVWFVHDDSWRIRGAETHLGKQLALKAKLVDPSGWRVKFFRAPNPWNWRLQGEYDFNEEFNNELVTAVRSNEDIADIDKLMIVKMEDDGGMVFSEVREFDLQTKVWGAAVRRESLLNDLPSTVFASIKTAFMPVTRIENVTDQDVLARVRGVGIANVAEQDENGNWVMKPNKASPVWIDDSEVLLPVILRRDRRGNMESITPIELAFLKVDGREGPNVKCVLSSMRRVTALSGRSGGKTLRLGLCVRAPDRKTVLRLQSNDKKKEALPGLMVYSHKPDQEKGTQNEYLGMTDWRGEIVIPPNEDAIRILFIASGRRPLGLIPVVPGLYDVVAAPMPNDESRLYAEGVIRGLENELMDLVAKRQVLQTRIEMAFEKNDLDRAEQLLEQLRDVPSSSLFVQDLSAEKKRLLFGDDRQQEMIIGYFAQLEGANSKFLSNARENELKREFQDRKRQRPGSQETN